MIEQIYHILLIFQSFWSNLVVYIDIIMLCHIHSYLFEQQISTDIYKKHIYALLQPILFNLTIKCGQTDLK